MKVFSREKLMEWALACGRNPNRLWTMDADGQPVNDGFVIGKSGCPYICDPKWEEDEN